MKIREGFVSNSSAASFVLDANQVSVAQLEILKNPSTYQGELGEYYLVDDYGSGWSIVLDGERIICETTMDNYDLQSFAMKIGIPDSAVSEAWYYND